MTFAYTERRERKKSSAEVNTIWEFICIPKSSLSGIKHRTSQPFLELRSHAASGIVVVEFS